LILHPEEFSAVRPLPPLDGSNGPNGRNNSKRHVKHWSGYVFN